LVGLVRPGPPGDAGWTLTTADFAIPPIGDIVTVNVENTGWIAIGQIIYVEDKDAGEAVPMEVTTKTATTVTLRTPPTYPTPISEDAGNLLTIGSDSLPYLDDTADAQIRTMFAFAGYNAIDNPTGVVASRGASFANVAHNTVTLDRWRVYTAGTLKATVAYYNTGLASTEWYPSPRHGMRVQCTTAQSNLAATDNFRIIQTIERNRMFPLLYGPSSLSFVARCNYTLFFSTVIRALDHSWHYISSHYAPNDFVFRRYTVPNIPSFPSPETTASWGTNNYDAGYAVELSLACGDSYQTDVWDTWETGTKVGTLDQGNLFTTVGNIFDFTLIKHEPGPICSPFAPVTFIEEEARCQRYLRVFADYPLGKAASAQELYSGGVIPIRMRTTPTQLAGGLFRVTTGSAGGVAPECYPDSIRLWNGSSNWTVNAFVWLDVAQFSAEI
jgi:hypothetical protein